MVPVFTNVGERSTAKNYGLLSPGEKCGFFVISSIVLDILLDQLQIFSQLYLL